MSKRLQITRSANATAVLSNGEMQWDFASQKLRIHDGSTAGGRVVIDMTQTGFGYVFPTPLAAGGVDWSSPTESKITASDAQAYDQFGYSVSINSDATYVIVGARQEDGGSGDPLSDAGAVYVYVRSGSTWSQQAKLVASDAGSPDYFAAVSINSDGDYAIIGAYNETSGAGAAYIFTRSGSTWTQQAKLTASDAESNDFFGTSVSINSDGTYAIIGATYEDTGGTNAGAAYVFTRSGSTWTQQAKIQSSDIQAADFFGQSVSINGDGDYAIVGAWQEETGGSDAGAAYIFTRSGSTWSQQAKIQSSDIQASDFFGYSVSINSDATYAIVGAFGEDGGSGDPLSNAGAAYVFSRSGSTWTQQAKLVSSDLQAGDSIGQAVAISGDGNTAILGAAFEDGGSGDPASNAGAVYVFTRSGSTWTQQARLTASDAATQARFGISATLNSDGSYAAVGAWLAHLGAVDDAGAAYIYKAG